MAFGLAFEIPVATRFLAVLAGAVDVAKIKRR